MWDPRHRIDWYSQVWEYLSRARNKVKGRPCTSGMHIHQRDGAVGPLFPIYISWRDPKSVFVTLYPDNKVEVDTRGRWLASRARQWFGMVNRKEKLERFMIAYTYNNRGVIMGRDDVVPLADKMVFDLRYRRFLTRLEPLQRNRNADNAKAWSKKVTAFRRKAKVMAKLEALDSYRNLLASVEYQGDPKARATAFGIDYTSGPEAAVYKAIDTCDPTLMYKAHLSWRISGYTLYRARHGRYNPTHQEVFNEIMGMYEFHRDAVRDMAGAIEIVRESNGYTPSVPK